MKLHPTEAVALRLMRDIGGGWWSAREYRAMGMTAAGMRCQVLVSMGLAEKRRAFPVQYRISEAGRTWLAEEDRA